MGTWISGIFALWPRIGHLVNLLKWEDLAKEDRAFWET